MTLAVCLLLITSSARANWQVVSAKSEASPNEALTHWRTELQDSVTAAKATLDCAIFRTDAATLQVIDQTDAPRKDLAEVMRETGALAGVNGGYFDPQEAPVGLLVSRGRTRSSLRRAKLLSGVLFATRSGKVDVVRSSRFRMSDHVEAAVQCGPLLVEDGEAVPGLNDSRQARRTFAAVDGRGHAILGVSSPVSLAQLARLLSQSNATGKLKPVRALNLDGGSSSAFWFAGEQGTKSIPELKTVRDFVAIVSHRRR
jgi:uncharacterized protein YigE (DUF2233 family)